MRKKKNPIPQESRVSAIKRYLKYALAAGLSLASALALYKYFGDRTAPIIDVAHRVISSQSEIPKEYTKSEPKTYTRKYTKPKIETKKPTSDIFSMDAKTLHRETDRAFIDKEIYDAVLDISQSTDTQHKDILELPEQQLKQLYRPDNLAELQRSDEIQAEFYKNMNRLVSAIPEKYRNTNDLWRAFKGKQQFIPKEYQTQMSKLVGDVARSRYPADKNARNKAQKLLIEMGKSFLPKKKRRARIAEISDPV